MSEARHCPQCGAPLSTQPGTPSLPKDLPGEPGPPKSADAEPDLPRVPLLAPGSNDDSFLDSPMGGRLAASEPDPILGEFVTPSSSRSVSSVLEEPRKGKGRSSANFPSLNFDAPPRSSSGPGRAPRVDPDGLEDDEGPEGRGAPWMFVLLASYASAITFALGWTLWKDRGRERLEDASRQPTVTLPASARQSGLSGKVEPPEPILGEFFTAIGQPLKVGSLEVTPLEVRREDVSLERSNVYAKPERKAGGKRTIALRLRLRNLSKDTVFAPLDQAYLRERGKQVVDTFLQAAGDDRIYPYPLAVESEWSIVGQDFSELRPGETRVVSIVSAPEVPQDVPGPLTWRVRLRTGINRTDRIGVRFPVLPPPPPPRKVGQLPSPSTEAGASIGRP